MTALLIFTALLMFVGALVQRGVGMGFGMITAPILALVWPEVVPVVIILVVTPLTLSMAARDRGAVLRADLPPLLGGKALGTATGAWLLALADAAWLAVLVGSMVVVAVGLSFGSFRLPAGRPWLGVAGLVSGVMGTTAATGGPPLAIAYQDAGGPQLRGTLATAFLFGNLMAVVGYGVIGRLNLMNILVAAGMLPVVALGAGVGTHLARRLDGRLRVPLLLVAGASGLIALARGLVQL